MVDFLHGVWNLVKFELQDDSGAWRNWGDDARGLLIYTEDGHVSVGINKNLADKDSRLENILFYSGTYQVKDNKIIHSIQNASDISRLDSELTREYSIQENQLKLTGTSQRGNKFCLVWTR